MKIILIVLSSLSISTVAHAVDVSKCVATDGNAEYTYASFTKASDDGVSMVSESTNFKFRIYSQEDGTLLTIQNKESGQVVTAFSEKGDATLTTGTTNPSPLFASILCLSK